MKPYSVWVKLDTGAWEKAFETDCAPCARDFARNNVSKTGWHIERIEVRDHSGVLATEYDRSWQ